MLFKVGEIIKALKYIDKRYLSLDLKTICTKPFSHDTLLVQKANQTESDEKSDECDHNFEGIDPMKYKIRL